MSLFVSLYVYSFNCRIFENKQIQEYQKKKKNNDNFSLNMNEWMNEWMFSCSWNKVKKNIKSQLRMSHHLQTSTSIQNRCSFTSAWRDKINARIAASELRLDILKKNNEEEEEIH